ncbi:hypothetical protein D7V82_15880 [bacterium 1xD8-6]|nr:hypothetical protein D7V72_04895 [bacterium D16-36]RKI65841.1 hypothetical protein D7V82_15880 [bacterium 1xD8-6]
MTMEVRTILELLQVFTAYSVCILLFPYIVFYHYLHEKTLAEKFIICIIIGNFYIMNIVFLMFLLHIPSKGMLYFLSVAPAVFAWRQINQPGIKRFFTILYTQVSRLFLGEAKIRTIGGILLSRPKKVLGNIIRGIFSHAVHHFLEWAILLALLSFNVWYYSYQPFTNYAYGTSDIIVHHYWINQMSQGNIFCAGIYPFGFHNIIYFLHTFFNIPTFSIMRVFGVLQAIYIYLMLYILLRKICRSRYIPFFGVFIFTLPHLFSLLANMRYQWAIPQEYAMLFLYPCAYFLIQFFERKKQEIETEKEWRQKKKLYAWLEQYHILPSTRSLAFFAMSFSMTLAVHFYITIIAILLCLAVAVAYFPVVLKPRYFWSIALAGILSLTCAVAPLVIAYLQGTPLEGSLRWAISVMTPGSSGENTGDESVDTTPKQNEETINDTKVETVLEKNPSSEANSSEDNLPDKNVSVFTKIKNFILTKGQTLFLFAKSTYKEIQKKFNSINNIIINYLRNAYNGLELSTIVVWLTEGLIVFTIVMILIRRSFYYRNLLSIGIYMLFLILLACAGPLHLPAPMELERAIIFLAYATPLVFACAADAIYAIICRPFRYHRFTEILPIGLTCSLTFLTVEYDYVKPLSIVYALQSRGEIICNYEIMENYPEKSWTIVTTTNSIQLIIDKGWHMEICNFLNAMEDYTTDSRVTIPTKHVFFYIEKLPLAYGAFAPVNEPLANTGPVSKENAEKPASFSGGNAYSITNRNQLQSRMYFWAQAFKKKYPQEFQIYYEDDSFICYRITQNEYNLYNFAIDYGFNK